MTILNQPLGNDSFLASRAPGLTTTEQREQAIAKTVTGYAIMTLGRNGEITDCNHGAEHIFAYTRDEIVGSDVAIHWSDDEQPHGPVNEREVALAKGIAENERIFLRSGGSRFLVRGALRSIYAADGTVGGFVSVCRDKTEHLSAEEYRSWLSAIIESSDDAIVSKSLDSVIRT